MVQQLEPFQRAAFICGLAKKNRQCALAVDRSRIRFGGLPAFGIGRCEGCGCSEGRSLRACLDGGGRTDAAIGIGFAPSASAERGDRGAGKRCSGEAGGDDAVDEVHGGCGSNDRLRLLAAARAFCQPTARVAVGPC